jgi:hypothetical protein
MSSIVIVVAGAVMFAAIVAIAQTTVKAMAKKHETAARQEFPDARRIESALFFGQKSRGAAQLRGNGTLVLEPSALVFKQWVVDRVFRIPYASILAIETPRSFLGKSQVVKLLCVEFRDDAGAEDAIAWRVHDLEGWIQAIEEARGNA